MKLVLFTSPDRGRAAMAAAFFNSLVDPVIACGIGAVPPGVTGSVEPEVRAVMNPLRQEIPLLEPSKLTGWLSSIADEVVDLAAEADAAPLADKLEWKIDDPRGRSPEIVGRIRRAIRDNVENLLMRRGWLKRTGASA